MMRYSKLMLFLVYSIWIALISSSCEEERQHPIPDVYVNFSINLFNDPEFFRLRNQGATVVVTNTTLGALNLGYLNNGIIIHNGGDDEFFAYDRTCPYDLPEGIAIETEPYSSIGTCPKCGSMYVFLSMGAPTTDSPSPWPLKRYSTVYNPNTGELFISNY